MKPTLIITSDGHVYSGLTPADAVDRMREAGIFTVGKTNAEYMSGVAGRAERLEGATIRTDSAENFLFDMAHHGLLTIGGQR
jgi:hypothetical protein